MNENYNQSYTRDEIAEYLNAVRECVENGNFTILQGRTRQKNVHFIRQYNIRYEMQKNIIKNLRVEDFAILWLVQIFSILVLCYMSLLRKLIYLI